MSGYPYSGQPQYPPQSLYPQIDPNNPLHPGQLGYPNPVNTQYVMNPQPGSFGYPYPGQPNQSLYTTPQNVGLSYPIAPTAPIPSAPMPSMLYGFSGYPGSTPQQGETVKWMPTNPSTAHLYTNNAVVAGYEAHDGSPLWVIRASFQGDLLPGKLAIKHRAAYVAWGGDEKHVNEFEVCCAPAEGIRWIESRDGAVPAQAIGAGRTASGETLYVGRAKEQGSLTPGKVHPSHKAMYISFAGKEIAHKIYEVLCYA